jgi:DNA polymerase III alpha subunit
MSYCNYHKHSYYTNLRVSDTVASPVDYAKRAVEVGDSILSSCEHGWCGRYIEGYELAHQNNLKCLISAEAYWVKNRLEKDSSNCHIFIAAKNENGRRALNDVLSEASISGFYFQPRLDRELILSLPPKDVWVTTACLAYWKYEDIDDITLEFARHFGDNFFLEVQAHKPEKQQRANMHILDFAAKHSLPIIAGCDSHYINSNDWQRDDFLKSKGMDYGDEAGWMLDYPDEETLRQRFIEQGILSRSQIDEAIGNTNVFADVEEYNCPCFNKEIKMPTLYPELTQEERNQKYKDIVWDAWEQEKQNVPQEQWQHYEEEIQKEIDVVRITNHADYFLDDYLLVKRAKEMGGNLTATGRGSAVSFITNKLLGFTDVDRIAATVKMYPERFISATRILETKSIADIDLNWGSTDVPAKAQEEVFGEGHSYPMIAYGTMKPKAAWKMFAKSQNVPFDISNDISAQITRYDNVLKHTDEDEKDNIDILDYIDKKYHEIYKQSVSYQGVVTSASIHPCSFLIYNGDIRREIGLMRVKDNLVCVMDGKWAEEYKFLKNDLLKVSVWDLIDQIYKRIGIKRHTIRELLNLTDGDENTWGIYKSGCTLGINQCEQQGTVQRVMKYAPQNISELCAFVAAIRPGFKSMFNIFESRKPFNYGIKAIDDIIQTEEMPNSFMLYQEQAMAVLNYAGIPMTECYEIIKNIAKKRVEKVLKYKEQVMTLLPAKLISDENIEDAEAQSLSKKIWTILEDSSRYSFNASHAYSVALDSLYGAYLKSHYPMQFYETLLRVLEKKGDKDRMAATKKEAERFFKVKFPPFRYGQDNRQVLANMETREITNTMQAIKGFGVTMGNSLYQCSKQGFTSFVDVLFWLDKKSIKEAKITPLINIDYFQQFGNIPTLGMIMEAFDFFKQGNAKEISKDKENPYLEPMLRYASCINAKGQELKTYKITDCRAVLYDCEDYVKALNLPDISTREKALLQMDILGDISLASNNPDDRWTVYVKNIKPVCRKKDGKQFGWNVVTVSLGSGKETMATIFTKSFIPGTQEGSVLKTKPSWWSRSGKYFNLDKYELME